MSPSAFAALASHAWPGNVRELQNVIAALAVKAPPRGRIGATLVSGLLSSETGGAPVERLAEARRQVDDRMVRAALARSGGHCGRAATELGLTRQGLAKLMTRLGIGKVLSSSDITTGC
ncbi:MAG: hypothetical protein HYZ58_16895 [Acidobacteria bacterium]|nr:hypothetical protein [Acidobacteriota bacterium]